MTPVNVKFLDRIKELNSQGLTLRDIIKIVSPEFNMREMTARAYFYRHNIKTRSHHKRVVNDKFFDNIDSEIKAYLLGFFIADGTIYKHPKKERISLRMSVGLHSKDRNVVEMFKEYICPQNTLYTYKQERHCAIQWSSTYMGSLLQDKYDIHIRKTYDLEFIFPFKYIAKNLIEHFIRGFFDGDGCVSLLTKNNKNIAFSFYGTSKPFLEQIGEIFKKQFLVDISITSRNRVNVELYHLTFVANKRKKQFIQELYDWLYEDASFYLQRKKDKFSTYLNTVLSQNSTDQRRA